MNRAELDKRDERIRELEEESRQWEKQSLTAVIEERNIWRKKTKDLLEAVDLIMKPPISTDDLRRLKEVMEKVRGR